jgi:hypothetical protein
MKEDGAGVNDAAIRPQKRERLVFLQSANFKPYHDDVELHVLVSPRKKRGAISRYLREGWGLNRVEAV